MKTKFEEFIEECIPNEVQRESMRVWVKNAVNGIKNKNALMLYGVGPTGKSTILRLIYHLFPTGSCWSCYQKELEDIYFRYEIKDSKLITLDGFSESGDTGALKSIIENLSMTARKVGSLTERGSYSEWPNVLIISNKLENCGVQRRSIVIVMKRDESKPLNKILLPELLAEKEFITDWFLK